MPVERLASVADFVCFLSRLELSRRLTDAEKAIAGGKGTNWGKVRSDV
jgi:hypothetical protein